MAFSTPEKQSEYNRRYYAENREKMREGMKRWREKNLDKHRASSREYHQKNRENILPIKRANWRENANELNARRRAKKFGIPIGAYDAMLAAQGGRCAICGDATKLVVDHDHKTGEVRELLCNPCNTGLGLFRENEDRLRMAIIYLARVRRSVAV